MTAITIMIAMVVSCQRRYASREGHEEEEVVVVFVVAFLILYAVGEMLSEQIDECHLHLGVRFFFLNYFSLLDLIRFIYVVLFVQCYYLYVKIYKVLLTFKCVIFVSNL